MTRTPRFFLCLSTTLTLLIACGPAQRRSTTAVLNDVESYINDRPDSALAMLRALDSTAVHGRALRARAALLHSMALDKCFIDLQTDSILSPAVLYYGQKGTPDERLKTLYYLGRLQYNANDYQQAIVTYTEALNFQQTAKDIKYKGFVYQAIADTYQRTCLYSDALDYCDLAYCMFERGNYDRYAMATLFKKAQLLIVTHQWEKADSLYSILLSSEGESLLKPMIMADSALSLLTGPKHKYEEAKNIFAEAIALGKGLPTANHWAAYAYSLFATGDTEQSSQLFSQLQKRYPSDKRISYWLSKKEIDNKEYERAYTNIQAALTYQDSITSVKLSQSALKAQKEFFARRTAESENVRQHQRFFAILIVFCLMIIVIIAVVFFYLKFQQNKRERLALQGLMDFAYQQQGALQQKYKMLIKDYFQMYWKIVEGIYKVDDKGMMDWKTYNQMKQLVRDMKGNIEGKRIFEETIDKHLDHLMSDFRRDFEKTLKDTDFILTSFLFAGFNAETGAVLLDITPEAYYMRKSRIKKVVKNAKGINKERYLSYF